MDFLSTDFLSALFAIIVIDLMLAGDNAIVIALAARNVPKHLQRRAILWGMAGAIAVRIAMTLIVVWLLKVPGLLGVGGALLIWIAYKLLLPEEPGHGHAQVDAASSFWGAMRTIVVADAIMGLDNVLAVAGAAHGSALLVVIGLLISVPIVVWGSGLILRYVERYPAIIYFGAAVLAWTAAKMIVSEPLISAAVHRHALIVPLIYGVIVVGVLLAGFWKNHLHLEARISARLAEFSSLCRTKGGVADKERQAVLVPVDGSPSSLQAVRRIVRDYPNEGPLDLHLLTVRPIMSQYMTRFVSPQVLESWHREQARKALRASRSLLTQHGIAFVEHVEHGPSAEVIVATAKRLKCDLIVMGTARKNSLTRMLESSVTNEVLEQTSVPVEVVVGRTLPRLEQLGLSAGALALLAVVATIVYDLFV